MSPSVEQLVAHYRMVLEERMQGLPILNPRLDVEAVGFRDHDGDRLGVLVTPWFMNLVLLPGTDEWADAEQGAISVVAFPSGPCEFTVGHDDTLGTFLSAILFRTVADFPDQATARAVAEEVMALLYAEPERGRAEESGRKVSRRGLITGLGAS